MAPALNAAFKAQTIVNNGQIDRKPRKKVFRCTRFCALKVWTLYPIMFDITWVNSSTSAGSSSSTITLRGLVPVFSVNIVFVFYPVAFNKPPVIRASHSFAGTGRPNTKPCRAWHPSSVIVLMWCSVSIPSATVLMFREFEISIIDFTTCRVEGQLTAGPTS